VDDDIEKLVDDILTRCVPGYVRPERQPKRRPPTPRDAFQSAELEPTRIDRPRKG
jgi:hypothetical protein